MASLKLCLVVLALLCIAVSASATTQLYVAPDTSATCPGQPCLTLSEYLNNRAQYFTSNTSFWFLEGYYFLESTLLLNDIVNLTMSGTGGRVRIAMSEGGKIVCVNSEVIKLNSLEVYYYGQAENHSESALMFDNSRSIEINGVYFAGIGDDQDYSRAINYIQSTGSITNCSFSGGRADYGGAVAMLSSEITFIGVNSYTSNTAEVSGGAVYAEDCRLLFRGLNNFTRNRASTVYSPGNFTIGGGALYTSRTQAWLIGFTNFVDNGPINKNEFILLGGAVMLRFGSNLTIEGRAVFSGNSADSGAGLFSVNSSLSIMGEVSFVENFAEFSTGGAIFAFNSVVLCRGTVSFRQNYAVTGGAIYIKRSALTFQESVTFDHNGARSGGGGTYALQSNVTTSGRASFVNNTAEAGGAMAFEGDEAQWVFHSPTTIDFYHNQAIVGGGVYFVDSNALYVAQCQNSSVEDIVCFFKVEGEDSAANIDVQLNFVNNSAIDAGSVLYGGALQLCKVQANGAIFTDSLQFFRNISTFQPNDDKSYISSQPLKVCFCENGEPRCSGERSRVIRVYRGQWFNVSLITVGVFDSPVRSLVRAVPDSLENSTEVSPSYHINEAVCSGSGFQLKTKADSKFLTLTPQGPCGAISVTTDLSLQLQVQLEPCPPGFESILNYCKCDSRLLEIDKDINCDINTGLVERPGRSWIKPLFDDNDNYLGFVLHPACPVGYCWDPDDDVMLNLSSNATDYQCTENRTGMVCGACKEGYSLILNAYICRQCSNQFLALTLVFVIAGIGLIAFLLALHMTVAAGTISGLVLYANVVNICRDIFFPPEETKVNPLTLFIAWLNLDFGIPTCLYDGLTAYGYAWLQFLFPFYLWFLIGLIIYFSKRSARIAKLFGSNPVAVLATVILMSYTKLLQTTVEVLSYTYVEYPDGTREKKWISDATVPFMEGKHVALAIFSLCVILLLLVPYILLLMFGYCLRAHSGKRGFRWFNKLTPFLDAYYAPFKKQARYWTGFLLLIRGSLFLTFILTTIGANLVAVTSLFAGIAIIPWLSGRIYERLYNDVLEASFLLNICVLTSVTYHVQALKDYHTQALLTHISVGIAFIEFVGIVIFHTVLRLRKVKCLQQLKLIKRASKALTTFKTKKQPLTDVVVMDEGRASTTVTFVAIREPLLEDD